MKNVKFREVPLICKPIQLRAKRMTSWLLCCGLLSGIPIISNAAPAAPIDKSAEFITCSQQLTNSDDRYLGSVIQAQLATLYKDNPIYKAQLKQSNKPLNDGIVGPKTRYWLAYYCGEFSFTAPKDPHHHFIQSLLLSLSRASQRSVLFPTWRGAITPPELLQLTPQQIMQKLALKASKTWHNRVIPAADTAPYYYEITENDLASLTLRHSVLKTLGKLGKQQFDSRSPLYNQLSDLFTQLNIPIEPPLNIDELIQSHTIETEQPASSTSKEGEAPTPMATVPTTQIVWQLNNSALQQTIKKLGISALGKEELKALAPLQDEVFPSLYLLKMAIKLAGLPPSVMEDKGVFSLAKKSGLSEPHPVPMQWNAPVNCGCEDSQDSIFSQATFYGFYPSWSHPQAGQTINFSRLDRIGYIGAVMKPEGHNSVLDLPQNWLPAPKFSQFIQTSHRYRSDIDLVVSAPRNLSRDQLTELFSRDMVKRLVKAVTTPLNGYFTNRVEPWITLGFKQVPTMADGITLDIDLSILNTQASRQAFISFVRQLKLALRASQSSPWHLAQNAMQAGMDDRYYVNVVVPIKELIEPNHSIFNFKNLNQLAPITNLFIMRPSTAEAVKPNNELTEIQQLQEWLSHQDNQTKAKQLFKHMVPMLITEHNRNRQDDLDQLINLSSWSFLGAAYWPVPLAVDNQKLIDANFFPTSTQLPASLNQLVSSVNTVLNWVCPNRWLLRMGLFISFTFIIVFLVLCMQRFPLRKYLSQMPFVALTAASIIGLMLAFIADPVFKDYQGPILLVFMLVIGAVLYAVRMVRKEGDKP